MKNTEYKVGDTVWFEQCWEDESGAYHDEAAEILEIKNDGELKLKWLNVSDEVKGYLEGCDEYNLEDISYKN